MSSIAIIGGGILGRVMGFRLALTGHTVTIYDRHSPGSTESCSYTGAGMLAPHCEREHAEAIISELGCQSIPLWQSLIKDLDQEVFFQLNGSLVVAHPNDHKELVRLANTLHDNVPTDAMTRVNGRIIQDLEPELKHFNDGLFFPDEGQISNRQVLKALANGLEERAVTWIERRIEESEMDELRAQYDWLIDCRGYWAKSALNGLRGVRGELVRIKCPEVSLQRPVRLMHPRYPIYIVPRQNHEFIIGATQIESEDFSEMSLQSMLELLSAAYTVHSGFAEARIIETRVNCRPAFRDNLPKITIQKNSIVVNGLYRHGFLISPALVSIVERYINQSLINDEFNEIVDLL